jgi:starch-binding outer membrane protein, SusD/RagB family
LNGGDTGVGNRAHLYFGMEYDIQPGMIRDIANGRPFKRFRPTDYMIGQFAANRDNDQRYEDNYKHVWICNDNRTSGNSIPLWKQIHVDKGAKKADGTLVTAADIGKRRFELGDTALYIPGPGQDAKWLGDGKLKVRYTVITKDKASYPASTLPTSDPNYYPSDPFVYNERLFPTIGTFFDPRRPTIQWERGSRDWFVMRHAETYLLRAEARFKQANLQGAADDINVVRSRAAKPGRVTQMQITSGDVTIDRILLERAFELDAEQCRWFDLVRTGKLVDYVKAYNPLGAGNVQAFHVRRPIPQQQIDRTVGGYEQNCGYPGGPSCN